MLELLGVLKSGKISQCLRREEKVWWRRWLIIGESTSFMWLEVVFRTGWDRVILVREGNNWRRKKWDWMIRISHWICRGRHFRLLRVSWIVSWKRLRICRICIIIDSWRVFNLLWIRDKRMISCAKRDTFYNNGDPMLKERSTLSNASKTLFKNPFGTKVSKPSEKPQELN